MIRTAIVDDEKPAQARLLHLLGKCADIEVVGVAGTGLEAVSLIREQTPDLLFLDVNMPQIDGFGVLRHTLPARMPLTIFVTAYDCYAVRAFDTDAVDYLLKPFSDERFGKALARARESLMRSAGAPMPKTAGAPDEALLVEDTATLDRIVVRNCGRVTFLNVKDLDWIEASGVYVTLHAGGQSHLLRSGLTQFLQRLDPRTFVRIHRSAAVNTTRIKELRACGHGDFRIVLHDGRNLILSRAYRLELERWLKQPL